MVSLAASEDKAALLDATGREGRATLGATALLAAPADGGETGVLTPVASGSCLTADTAPSAGSERSRAAPSASGSVGGGPCKGVGASPEARYSSARLRAAVS